MGTAGSFKELISAYFIDNKSNLSMTKDQPDNPNAEEPGLATLPSQTDLPLGL